MYCQGQIPRRAAAQSLDDFLLGQTWPWALDHGQEGLEPSPWWFLVPELTLRSTTLVSRLWWACLPPGPWGGWLAPDHGRWVVSGAGQRERAIRWGSQGDQKTSGGDGEIRHLDCSDGWFHRCLYMNLYQTYQGAHFKSVLLTMYINCTTHTQNK